MIRVDTEEKLSVLTVQDVGQIMPGGRRAFWVGSRIFQRSYLSVPGINKMLNTFKVV